MLIYLTEGEGNLRGLGDFGKRDHQCAHCPGLQSNLSEHEAFPTWPHLSVSFSALGKPSPPVHSFNCCSTNAQRTFMPQTFAEAWPSPWGLSWSTSLLVVAHHLLIHSFIQHVLSTQLQSAVPDTPDSSSCCFQRTPCLMGEMWKLSVNYSSLWISAKLKVKRVRKVIFLSWELEAVFMYTVNSHLLPIKSRLLFYYFYFYIP